MRMKLTSGACVLALVLGSISTSALAYPAETVPDAIRSEAAPVSLHVIVPQMEIAVGINPAGGGGAQQGGIVGALILGAMDASRAKKGVSKADQARIALDGVDVDAIARAETARAFANVKWVAASKASFAKDATLWGKMAVLDAGSAPHQANIEYSYDLSPDFSTLTVFAAIQIVDKVNPKAKTPEKRLAIERLAYVEGAHVIAAIPIASAGPDDAFKLWTENGAKLLKETLTASFAKAADLSARAMQTTPADLIQMNAKDREKLSFGWHRGRIVEGADSIESAGGSNGLVRKSATVKPGAPGVLIWADYFVHARALKVVK
jgi:hypothetical protein